MRYRNSKPRWRTPLVGGLLLLIALGALAVFNAPGQASEFGGEDRYLAHVSTDKPIYRAGETVYFRTVLLHAFNHKPLQTGASGNLKIKNPRGSVIVDSHFRIEQASGGASWQIPSGTAGGEYTAEISFPSQGFPTAERKFDIRAYRAPRIKTQMEFLKKAYGPGDKVSAVLEAKRAEGGVPADAKVTAVARVDGEEVWRGKTSVDAKGNCAVSFELPKEIEAGVGSLTLVIEDGGVVESASKTLPILLQQIPVAFCPEGGDLVGGLECGLYFEATTPWGDPADIKGQIVDANGNAVADFATRHEGRGNVRFTPETGKQYFAKITEPAGITKLNALPKVLGSGASLRAEQPCYASGKPVDFKVAATDAGTYKLALFQREKELAAMEMDLDAGGECRVILTPPSGTDGVLRATLFDGEGNPLAERLVFRKPESQLNIEIEASPENAVPGEKVELKIKTTDANGDPVSSVVGLTVSDDAVLEMIEKREQAPRLPVMAFLENEVDHLEDAHVYLSDDPKAESAVDLLLGTQGWRRFAYLTPKEFIKQHGDKAKRAIAFRKDVDPHDAVGLAGGFGGGGGRVRGAVPPAAAEGAEPEADGGAPQTGAEEKGEAVPEANEQPDADREDQVADEKRPMRKIAEDPAAEPEAEEALGRRRRDFRRQQQLVTIREYAHQLREGRKPGDRRDFTETLYWNAGVKTDDKGEATVSFFLSDSVTSFRVMADGYTSGGALGQGDVMITSREPFYLEPKLPLEVTAGDKLLLPVSLVNSTDGSMKVVLEAEGGEAISLPENFNGELELQADERGRLLLPVTVGRHNGQVSLTLAGKAGAFSDRVTREIAVKPMGFPISYSVGGMLKKPQAFTVTIPEDVHLSSITTSAKVYPTPAANLMAAVERLIREPYG